MPIYNSFISLEAIVLASIFFVEDCMCAFLKNANSDESKKKYGFGSYVLNYEK